MNSDFKIILNWLIKGLINKQEKNNSSDFAGVSDETDMADRLNRAFLSALIEDESLESRKSYKFLIEMKSDQQWGDVSDFYLKGIEGLTSEIDTVACNDDHFNKRLKTLSQWIKDGNCTIDEHEAFEHVWSVFFPEGCNILYEKTEKIEALRNKRRIKIESLNNNPITDPAEQILFTSNVLLTLPPSSPAIETLPISDSIKDKLAVVLKEDQSYWYDHPIQIGVNSENNEFLYGLQGLENAIRFEKRRGNVSEDQKTICLLSVSVTHKGLHEIARPYLEDVLNRSEGLDDLDVYVFTETDAQNIIHEIIAPAAEHLLNRDSSELMDVFGVDGEYGRHYSFLKAIALFWNIMVKDTIRATFKIDLDQVFPQDELVNETEKSAFEHLSTDLWGAHGTDSTGMPVELGMIAGALVNESDIHKSLFTPDVGFPSSKPRADEVIFFSQLPQALSTEAEMMTGYDENNSIDGKNSCIERIHVTGGTNGILIDSLKKHKPFTPSFIGRAEDQAYIFSTLFNVRERLAYVHKDGLIMRHDKEAFAQEAIKSAYVSKIIGDYIRILYFSAYAKVISEDPGKVKDLVDPFTGCFISYIPVTVVYLRFALKAMSMFEDGKANEALEFICSGSKRVSSAIDFSVGKESQLKKQYKKERRAWKLFYDTLSAIEDSIRDGNDFGMELKQKALNIVSRCLLKKQSKGVKK